MATLELLPAQLIDMIYAAVVGEITWEQFLSAAGRLFNDGKAILFYHDSKHKNGRFLVTSGFDPEAVGRYTSHYSSINCWMQKAQSRPIGIASHSSRLLSREELLRTEFYNDFLREQNIDSGFGLTICRDLDCSFMFSVLGKSLDESQIEQRSSVVQSLMPHLERAANFYRRGNGGLGSPSGGHELDLLSIGMIRVGIGRQIKFVNDTAASLLESRCALFTDARGRLACLDAELLRAIDDMSSNWRSAAPLTPKTFILSATDSSPPMRATLIPPPADEAVNFFRGPECTLLIERPRLDVKTAISGLAKTSGLTSAETVIVEGLASGLSLKDIALARAVSTDTVRAQVKSVFAKTGFRSQAELIRHVASLAG